MRQRNHRILGSLSAGGKKGVAGVTSRFLQANALLFGKGRTVDTPHVQGHAKPYAKRAAECLIRIGFCAPQAVVHVGSHNCKPLGLPLITQPMQQRRRIRAAGKAGYNGCAAGKHLISLDGLRRLLR